QPRDYAVAQTVTVDGRHVARQTAPDVHAFRLDGQGLRHLQAGIRLDLDPHVVVEDGLPGLKQRRHQQAKERKKQAPHRVNSTATAERSASAAWKNSASRKPNVRATNRSGKRWMASL